MGDVIQFKSAEGWRDIESWDDRDGYVLLIDKDKVPVVAEYDGLNFVDPIHGWIAMESPTHWARIPKI